MNELSLIYTQASIHCLHFTTATPIIFVLSAKITTLQRTRKPPKSTDIWSVMHILSLSLYNWSRRIFKRTMHFFPFDGLVL